MLQFHPQEQFHDKQSPVHALDARIKVVIAFVYILSASLVPFGHFLTFGLLCLLVLSGIVLSQIGVGYVLRRSVVALPFALAAITLLFTTPGQPLLTLPLLGGVSISLEGTSRFVSIVIKSWLSLQIAILLGCITPFPQLIWSLHALRVPSLLVTIVSFAYRYLFILSDEVLRLLRARSP